MTCKLNACSEKSTNSSNTQHMIVGTVVGLGLLYVLFSKRK